MSHRSPSSLFRYWFTIARMQAVLDSLQGRSFRGLDGLRPSSFRPQDLSVVKRKVLAGIYQFTPYVERLVSKGKGKPPRVLALATVRDRIVLQLLKEVLHSVFEDRVGRRLPNQFIRDIRVAVRQETTNLWVARYDIKSFYDQIDQDLLMSQISQRIKSERVLTIIRRAIQNPTVPRQSRRADRPRIDNTGVPQGLPVSNILAEIYLTNFDQEVSAQGIFWRRFVDDIVVIGKEAEVEGAEQIIEQHLLGLGLSLNKEKRHRSLVVDGFDFLGYHITPTVITVRQSSVDRFLSRLAGLISGFRSRQASSSDLRISRDRRLRSLVNEVNLMVTGAISDGKSYGWLLYFLELDDLDLLFRLDRLVGTFLHRVPDADTAPLERRRLVRAYYEAKYSRNSGYILNYGNFVTSEQRRQFLVEWGDLTVAEADFIDESEIDRRFESRRWQTLLKLERDVGTLS